MNKLINFKECGIIGRFSDQIDRASPFDSLYSKILGDRSIERTFQIFEFLIKLLETFGKIVNALGVPKNFTSEKILSQKRLLKTSCSR